MTIQLETTLSDSHPTQRLDQALATCFADHSRARLQTWIKSGFVTVNDVVCDKNRQLVQAGDRIKIDAIESGQTTLTPQPIPLTILFEDEHMLILNKPVGLVVHPGAGHLDSTLVNALLHHEPNLKVLPRAGLVHRLDKDTSGLLVIAKSLAAHTHLVTMLQNRDISREYLAIVHGQLIAGGTIDEPIGRDPHHRTKMAVVHSGKPAITHYRIQEKFQHHTMLNVRLETGRTHQIRVHLRHIQYPIVGDPVYGTRRRFSKKSSDALRHFLETFTRQALHAQALSFTHPITGEQIEATAPLPNDMQTLVRLLRDNDASSPC